MLKIENLTKYYGDKKGIEKLNLEIKTGEVFGLIGPNGAGKSTTIRSVLGLIKSEGLVLFNGKLITPKIKEEIGYLPSEIHLYQDLTVKEMLEYSASFYDRNLAKRIKELVKRLKVDMSKRVGDLSYGNLKKVGIIIALMHEPRLLILDEPTNGLDPLIQEEFYQILIEEQLKGTTIFFSSHILSEIKRVCDRVGIIKDGELIQVVDVKNIDKTPTYLVTITSSEYKKLRLPVKHTKIKRETSKTLQVLYNGDLNELIQILSEINIEALTIEEPHLEEIFMSYYK